MSDRDKKQTHSRSDEAKRSYKARGTEKRKENRVREQNDRMVHNIAELDRLGVTYTGKNPSKALRLHKRAQERAGQK